LKFASATKENMTHAAPARLIAPELFAPAFEPLRGKRIAYVSLPGNWGDRLIDQGAFEMFDHFGVTVADVGPFYHHNQVAPPEAEVCQHPHIHGMRPKLEGIDCIVLAGGGSMGTCYLESGAIRTHLRSFGVPIVVMPSTFTNPDPHVDHYAQAYVRENGSLIHHPKGVLVPDLALAVTHSLAGPPSRPGGLFLRQDGEALYGHLPSAANPHARISLAEYLAMAERQNYIITDCLHFAIAGLYFQRDVTLLPGAIHKNRSMWETWLRDLGVKWKDAP
jgi:exopolysaccharide biosynthesis predicted pyruvyltransferase EpsI